MCEGRVAQLEERGVCNAEAWGSNPHGSTFDAPGNASFAGEGFESWIPQDDEAVYRNLCV